MSGRFESRDSPHSTTSKMIVGLLLGNVIAILAAIGFGPSNVDGLGPQGSLVLAVGVMSLITAALLFLATAVRRRGSIWWTLALVLNLLQMARLLVAVVAVTGWDPLSAVAAMLWSGLFVPLLGLLSAVGLVMTVREIRKNRRRRLLHAS
jgi:cytochrome c oxidase subunit IV